ncbi:MAG: hypothetical protein J6Z80_02110 [Clostridia bacterium]|nr:hypothetical protein [Clostridia bacterium]
MKAKRIIALITAALMLALALASCSAGGTDKPAGTTAKPAETTEKPAEETTNKPAEETTEKEVVTTNDPFIDENGLPTVRTLYNNDPGNISPLALADFGFTGKIDIKKRTGYGYAIDAQMSEDGELTPRVDREINWTGKSNSAQWTWDEKFHYMPFTFYKDGVTINEIIMGEVTSWGWERDADGNFVNPAYFSDFDRLQIWYTDNPDDTWTRWDCKATGDRNWPSDEPTLRGTPTQAIRFIGPDVTAKYFMMYDPDPQETELWTGVGTNSFYGIYDPANVAGE